MTAQNSAVIPAKFAENNQNRASTARYRKFFRMMMNSTYYTSSASGAPIYTSRSIRRVTVGRADSLMSYGDKISVRVVAGGQRVMEYETKQVADMTDLTGDLRRRAKGMHGLVVVYIRNHDRGWTQEKRIMLYPQRKRTPAQRPQAIQVPMFYPWEL